LSSSGLALNIIVTSSCMLAAVISIGGIWRRRDADV